MEAEAPEEQASRPVEVILEDQRWAGIRLGEVAGAAARATLEALGRDPDAHEISLLGCDDARITQLNGQFREKPRPTNVLSWPSGEVGVPEEGEDPVFLGDMALAYETCAAEADAAELALSAHVTHLVVHGVLHLLGYDHDDDEQASDMEAIEVKILASLGIGNPYT